jgi:hypothetical protein
MGRLSRSPPPRTRGARGRLRSCVVNEARHQRSCSQRGSERASASPNPLVTAGAKGARISRCQSGSWTCSRWSQRQRCCRLRAASRIPTSLVASSSNPVRNPRLLDPRSSRDGLCRHATSRDEHHECPSDSDFAAGFSDCSFDEEHFESCLDDLERAIDAIDCSEPGSAQRSADPPPQATRVGSLESAARASPAATHPHDPPQFTQPHPWKTHPRSVSSRRA